jgi:release factor glutamine methyltransferase
MRRWFKRGISVFLIPFVRWYLQKERSFSRYGIEVSVPPGVFHPGLFYSTQFLAKHLILESLAGQAILELGCGTGFLSVLCAKQGAKVTASDVSAAAVHCTQRNADKNSVEVTAVQSNLFESLGTQTFDRILINPPYYAQQPKNDADRAWYCGEHFEYFHQLFKTLKPFTHPQTETWMVLTQGCDLDTIFSIAHNNGFDLQLLKEQRVFFDGKDFLFRIRSSEQ